MDRKTPIRHKVDSYKKDDGTKVKSHVKGTGVAKTTPTLTKVKPKRETLASMFKTLEGYYADKRNPKSWTVDVIKGKSGIFIEFEDPIMFTDFGSGGYGLQASWGHIVPFDSNKPLPHEGVMEELMKAPTMIAVPEGASYSAYNKAHNITGLKALSGGEEILMREQGTFGKHISSFKLDEAKIFIKRLKDAKFKIKLRRR